MTYDDSVSELPVCMAMLFVSCQAVFLNHVELDKNIARNRALKENVFMMIVCIELRIPLFLVGKPGSSKSLAKTIVADAMQGINAKNDFFNQLKFVCVNRSSLLINLWCMKHRERSSGRI